MQKLALPVIFLASVGAVLYYVSGEAHSAGTLFVFAAVLLVGQICATLPFIFEARRPRAGTPDLIADLQKKTIANQQVIQDDMRALGEALIKRLNAISERQNVLEKKLQAVSEAEDLSSDFDELSQKLDHAFEERLDALRESLEESLSNCVSEALPEEEDFSRHFENTAERLEEILCALENAEEKNSGDAEAHGEEPVVPADEDDEDVEDFPESDDDDVPAPAQPTPAQNQDFVAADLPRATLIFDAMLGIENKPFLRGNAPGLSLERGVPMNFVEIGIWRFDFQPSAEEITVTIHLNDAETPLEEPITLAPGQTLEIRYTPER